MNHVHITNHPNQTLGQDVGQSVVLPDAGVQRPHGEGDGEELVGPHRQPSRARRHTLQGGEPQIGKSIVFLMIPPGNVAYLQLILKRGGSIPIPKGSRFRFLGHFWHILEELEPELESKES